MDILSFYKRDPALVAEELETLGAAAVLGEAFLFETSIGML
jgi:hypothetical protein